MPTLRVHGRHALHGDESTHLRVRREAETSEPRAQRDETSGRWATSPVVGLFATFFATAPPHTRAASRPEVFLRRVGRTRYPISSSAGS